MVEIVEAYRDYTPPGRARGAVEALIESVPPHFLSGLKRVVLTNEAALTGRRRRGWSWSRGRKARHSHVGGLYHPRSREEPAWIELFVDKIVQDVPSWALRLRLVRSGVFGVFLYHELGHHIHAEQQPEHREREAVADEWCSRLGRNHLRRRHPIARVVLRLPARLLSAVLARRRRKPPA